LRREKTPTSIEGVNEWPLITFEAAATENGRRSSSSSYMFLKAENQNKQASERKRESFVKGEKSTT
jgi:hypothetical protein